MFKSLFEFKIEKTVIGVWAYELILYDYVLMYMTQGGGWFPRRREMVNGLSGERIGMGLNER